MKTTNYTVTRLISSSAAETGASRLLENIRSGYIRQPVLPNKYPKFTGKLEEKDYTSYCRFIGSANGLKLLKKLEEQDERTNA